MQKPPVPKNENERLQALLDYTILDTPPEVRFDEIVQLASNICGTSISLISLVDSERQWFKANIGIPATETPRDISFCGHVIAGSEILIVPDALKDSRFMDNPLVTGGPKIRFYAGAPLTTPEGHSIGTLCVIDPEPRHLTADQQSALAFLSKQTIALLELDKALKKSQENFKELQRLTRIVKEREQLLYSNSKLVSLGEMATGIAHEINNPLGIILGRLALLRSSFEQGLPPPNNEVAQTIAKLEIAAERIEKIIKSMKSISRSDLEAELHLERISVKSLVDEVSELFRNSNHLVKITFKGKDIPFLGDYVQISQVIINLIQNSLHAMATQEGWIEIETEEIDGFLKLSITDNGPGISEDVKDKVFLPFFTTKNPGKGTGLGLTISHTIVKAHGGNLVLDRASPYTKFVITLPLALRTFK
jgi:two-component system, NtrC family, sensor kinase